MVWSEIEPFIDLLRVYLSNVWLVTTHLRNLAKVLVWERMKWHYSGSTKSLVFWMSGLEEIFLYYIFEVDKQLGAKNCFIFGPFFVCLLCFKTEWKPLMTLTQGSWLTGNRPLSMSPSSQPVKNKVCIIPGWSYSPLLPTSNAWK